MRRRAGHPRWAHSTFSADKLDLCYAANASSPSWTLIGTLSPTVAGAQTLSATYTLPSGSSLQAVRAAFRYQGSAGAFDHAGARTRSRGVRMTSDAFQDSYPDDLSHCYGCGRLNQQGLQLKSRWSAEETVATFVPRAHHIAVPGYVYGGLIASLIDCHGTGTAAAAAARAAGQELGRDSPFRFVTAALRVAHLRPTPLGVPLEVRGTVKEVTARKVVVAATVSAEGQVCARGEVVRPVDETQAIPGQILAHTGGTNGLFRCIGSRPSFTKPAARHHLNGRQRQDRRHHYQCSGFGLTNLQAVNTKRVTGEQGCST